MGEERPSLERRRAEVECAADGEHRHVRVGRDRAPLPYRRGRPLEAEGSVPDPSYGPRPEPAQRALRHLVERALQQRRPVRDRRVRLPGEGAVVATRGRVDGVESAGVTLSVHEFG